jgi:hypothetical protein
VCNELLCIYYPASKMKQYQVRWLMFVTLTIQEAGDGEDGGSRSTLAKSQ